MHPGSPWDQNTNKLTSCIYKDQILTQKHNIKSVTQNFNNIYDQFYMLVMFLVSDGDEHDYYRMLSADSINFSREN